MTVKQKHCETCQQFGKGTCNAFKCIARNYCDWEEIKRPKPMQNTSNMGKPKELDWELNKEQKDWLLDVLNTNSDNALKVILINGLISKTLTQQRTELLEEILGLEII